MMEEHLISSQTATATEFSQCLHLCDAHRIYHGIAHGANQSATPQALLQCDLIDRRR